MSSVNLIVGPAGSGKTNRVLAEFRSEIARNQALGRFSTTLWITPTRRSRQQILRSLLAEQLSVCFSPGVWTFEDFAEQILRTAPVAIQSLGPIAKRKLVRDLIDDLSRRGRLKYFSGVAHTTGFLDLCISFISELKRAEIWPDEFSSLLERIGGSEGDAATTGRRVGLKNTEIAEIYAAYQDRLHAVEETQASREVVSGLYDAEGRFWSARTLMKSGHRGPFRELSCVVVDGFTDFTRTQHEILETLAEWTERLWITLPGESPDRGSDERADLFSKVAASRNALRAAFAAFEFNEIAPSSAHVPSSTAFEHVAKHLFDNPRQTPQRLDANGIAVLSCVRRSGELEAVAKRVKSLLTQGVSAENIVVAFRSLEGNADAMRAVLEEAGVPVAVESGSPILSVGSVRFLLSLLDLELEDWPFPRVASVVNSQCYRPTGRVDESELAARYVTFALRSMKLDVGREVILGAVGRRAERENEKHHVEFATAARALRLLSDELELLRGTASFSAWVDRLLVVAAKTGITSVVSELSRAGDDGSNRTESEGWDAFLRLIEEGKNAATLCGKTARAIHLADFRRQLMELLAGQTFGRMRPETGRVRVLSAEQVRNLDIPHLFLCGMSESTFPQSRGDDCFYDDTERHRLTKQGLPLSHRARHSRDEMLLFYAVVTRARQSLTLSYPSIDDGGEPLNASPFVSAVTGLFEAGKDLIETAGGLDPVPCGESTCATEADLRILATSEALAGRAGLFHLLVSRVQSAQTALNVVAAADMAAARFETRGLTNYEGMLADPRNLKRLQKRFGVAHEFSATELEAYAAHPFRFYLNYVLGLEPLTIPEPGTDYAKRGNVMHASLAALHAQLTALETEADSEALVGLLHQKLDEALGTWGDTPLQRALRRIERQILSPGVCRYGAQWEEYLAKIGSHWDVPPMPLHFEIPFGNAPLEPGDVEGLRHPVVAFGVEGDVVRVRGRVDRIDVGTADGKAVFNVIDYKLSRKPPTFTLADVELGRALQLVLYSMAVRRLGFIDGELFQFGFWSLSGDGFISGLKQRARGLSPLDDEVAASLEQLVDAVLPRLVKSIRSGAFPLVVDDPAEEYYPEFAAVGRTAAFRAVAERLEKSPVADSSAPHAAS